MFNRRAGCLGNPLVRFCEGLGGNRETRAALPTRLQIFELLLQHLRVCFFEPRQILFKLRPQKRCGCIGQVFAGFFKRLLTSAKPVVENETRMPELYSQRLLLLLIRVDTVLICATYFHNFINNTFYPFCLGKNAKVKTHIPHL